MHTPLQNKNSPARIQHQHSHNQHCVCQICTCGKHSCPEPYVPFNADTSYHQHYKPYQVQSTGPTRVDYIPSNSRYDPNYLKSTYEANYVNHPMERDRMPLEKYEYRPSNTPFEDETQYRKNYIPSKVSIEEPIRNVNYIPNQTKFEGSTTYNAEYSAKPLSPYSPSKREGYQMKSLPFEGKTTYDSQYQPHKIQAVRPDSNVGSRYIGSSSKFEGQSRYKEDYNRYKQEDKKHCPVQGLPSRPLRCSPGKQHLHYSTQKQRWD